MRMHSKLGFLALIAVWAISCNNAQRTREEAEKVLSHHYSLMAAKKYEEAIDDYGMQFLFKMPGPEWVATLKMVEGKLGDFKYYTIGSTTMQADGIAGPGEYVEFDCQSFYAKDKAEEKVTLFRSRKIPGGFKIIGHQIFSETLRPK